MNSIDYYDKNAEEFFKRTIHADMQESYEKFLEKLPKEARILDAGCGVGRDSKFFQKLGYDLVAFDGSIEMVNSASHLLQTKVLHLRFDEIEFSDEFDAIWASASLLHVPYEQLNAILNRFHKALSPSGILYASFKYGSSMRQEGERFFYDMNEITITPYLQGLFQPLAIWKTADTRSQVAPSPDKSWLNCLAKRI
jgi:SAM-dependent methyltransferase